MLVMKFGGTSVSDPARIKELVSIVKERSSASELTLVVVSALAGVTNDLLKISNEAAIASEKYFALLDILTKRHLDCVGAIVPPKNRAAVLANVTVLLNELSDVVKGIALVGEASARTKDSVASFGERLSSLIVREAFDASGVSAELVDARELICTNENYGSAQVDWKKTEAKVKQKFANQKGIVVVPGFIAKSESGVTTTLGRGGSDYSASILGSILKAKEIQIWTDVNGVMTADPRKVPNAFSLESVTFEEMMELSHFGAKVVYPPTLQPAMVGGLAVRILNSFDPKHAGTLISNNAGGNSFPITGISSIDQISLLRVQGSGMVGIAGTASRVFRALAAADTNVILITQASSEHTICVAIKPEDGDKAKQALDLEFAYEQSLGGVVPTIVEEGLSILSVVGQNMQHCPGISGRVFSALGRYNVNIIAIAQGSSELNISCVINQRDLEKSLNVVHDEFFLSTLQIINLYMIGSGNVGGELLKQLGAHAKVLKETEHVELRLIGLANSRFMQFQESGLPWEKLSTEGSSPFSLKSFVSEIKKLNRPHSIFVDCTSNSAVTECYADLLANGVAVVTPNKKLQSESYAKYIEVRTASRKRGAPFLFETSVGAGLPVISTLRDLISSGDRILSIRGMLSGTLGYLFGKFASSNDRFSKLVLDAKNSGLTEPDPRDDLCGMDVARKLVILVREAGYRLELSDVNVQSLVPEALRDPTLSVDQFIKRIPEFDSDFEKLRPTSKNQKLCYLAQYDGVTAKVGIEVVSESDPFFQLHEEENMVAFSTPRYAKLPLVVRGPGAGAAVTAAGILADIVRVALRR